jgi:hypothetical protein
VFLRKKKAMPPALCCASSLDANNHNIVTNYARQASLPNTSDYKKRQTQCRLALASLQPSPPSWYHLPQPMTENGNKKYVKEMLQYKI